MISSVEDYGSGSTPVDAISPTVSSGCWSLHVCIRFHLRHFCTAVVLIWPVSGSRIFHYCRAGIWVQNLQQALPLPELGFEVGDFFDSVRWGCWRLHDALRDAWRSVGFSVEAY